MSERPSIDSYLLQLAIIASRRTTCIRRGVGCVLADAKGHVLSIGYNGVAAGMPHCNEIILQGADFKPWGKPELGLTRPSRMVATTPHACAGHDLPPGHDSCEAIHAETNALLQCRRPEAIATAYCTLSPCLPCTKLFLNTSCSRIVFLEQHPRSEEAERLWSAKAGRSWEHHQERIAL